MSSITITKIITTISSISTPKSITTKTTTPTILHILTFLFLIPHVLSGAVGVKHHFKIGERVELWANNVGPVGNPSETYLFFSLPFCQPEKEERRSQRMGQVISGDRSVLSDYILPFRESFKNHKLCDVELTKSSINQFKQAISENYFFELFFDDLPIFGFLGAHDGGLGFDNVDKFYLFTHWDFTIEYNGNEVIHVNITTPNTHLRELSLSSPILSFTYSAQWLETNVQFEDRRDIYQNIYFNPNNNNNNKFGFPLRSEFGIHWISIVNSFFIVILLSSFLVFTVIRMTHGEYSKYIMEEEGQNAVLHGWKLIRGDVFRFPPFLSLFCGFLGMGCQFISIIIGTLFLSLVDLLFSSRASSGSNIYGTCVFLYAITSGFAGYVSAKTYKQFGGTKWKKNILLAAIGLFAIPFACSFAFINGIAIHFQVTTALPFVTILEVTSIWIFVGFPLTVIGGLAGIRFAGEFYIPYKPRSSPRHIPNIPWYYKTPVQMLVAGFLPFTAIYIELFYIYSSVWGHHYYTFYGILCLVFVILNIVTACVTISLTYFRLSREDYRWWWPAFLNGGSTGIYIYVYSIYYFIHQTKMTGLFQAAFYFTYLLVTCYVFFVLLGTVGFFASLFFVKMIYKRIGGFD